MMVGGKARRRCVCLRGGAGGVKLRNWFFVF